MTDRTTAETHAAFEAAIVAVMDYYKSLLAAEREKVAELEARQPTIFGRPFDDGDMILRPGTGDAWRHTHTAHGLVWVKIPYPNDTEETPDAR